MKGIAQNMLVPIVIGIIAVSVSAAFISLSFTGYFSRTEGTTTTTLQENPTTTTTTTLQESGTVCNAPYIRYGEECCLDQNSNSICDEDEPKPNCPHECCINDDYKSKQCAYNEDCINNQCVKKECPYECCDGTTYQIKSCSSEHECVNNKCEEIKVPKLSLTVDACKLNLNILEMKGEVTDIYATVTNYGTKEAIDVKISSTANDVEAEYGKSKATIGALPSGSSQRFKVTVDTDSQTPTHSVSVTVSCDECSPISITETNPDCQIDFDKIKGEIDYWTDIGGKILESVIPG